MKIKLGVTNVNLSNLAKLPVIAIDALKLVTP